MANHSVSDIHASHSPIYLDNLATTPVDPRVLDAVLPFYGSQYGNASSMTHGFGWQAADAVAKAREQTATLIGARARDIVFTSGATEANNFALKGMLDASEGRSQIITCATEHPSVLDCAVALRDRGFDVMVLPVDSSGQLDPDELRNSISSRTLLVSVMAANNEVGTLQRLKDIGTVTTSAGVPWHCDAAQAVGKIPFDVDELGVDLLSMSAHKIYAPKGVGALFVRSNRRPRLRLTAQLEGGGQERGLRSGTVNVPGVVGLGAACEIATAEMAEESERLCGLRNVLQLRLENNGASINGHPEQRLPGCLSATLQCVDSAALLPALRHKLAISNGSACKSGSNAPSHVLKAMGIEDTAAARTIRFGLGRFTTEAEVVQAGEYLAEVLAGQIRSSVSRVAGSASDGLIV